MADENKKKTDRKVIKIYDKGDLTRKQIKLEEGLKYHTIEVTETTITAINKRSGKKIIIEVEKSES